MEPLSIRLAQWWPRLGPGEPRPGAQGLPSLVVFLPGACSRLRGLLSAHLHHVCRLTTQGPFCLQQYPSLYPRTSTVKSRFLPPSSGITVASTYPTWLPPRCGIYLRSKASAQPPLTRPERRQPASPCTLFGLHIIYCYPLFAVFAGLHIYHRTPTETYVEPLTRSDKSSSVTRIHTCRPPSADATLLSPALCSSRHSHIPRRTPTLSSYPRV
ncbi:hypothetical protein B0T11DRAFT_83976 [Plectosphaerella cucumerina]|jgi:hypothetical protein|uniref:Uncharacterized protein n=1 Tax=Plectosphaerella cucumerina TaxID=40658 RepID=A0A8K0TD45_9PEZI|nr:hypothetical protein B0T11DRAFT_83976 [Plectosphaerella cucumerina]